MKRLVVIHGDKGGIGKTETARRTVAALLSLDPEITIVDGDSKNPGLHSAFKKHHQNCRCVNVMTPDGLSELFSIVEAARGDVILDLPARGSDTTQMMSGDGTDERSFPLDEILKELNVELNILFVIDQTKAPLLALRDEIEVLPDANWIVVRNHRETRPFTLFEHSEIKKLLDEKSIPIIDLARLDPDVNDILEAKMENLIVGQNSKHLSMIQKMRAKATLRVWTEQLLKAGLIRG